MLDAGEGDGKVCDVRDWRDGFGGLLRLDSGRKGDVCIGRFLTSNTSVLFEEIPRLINGRGIFVGKR